MKYTKVVIFLCALILSVNGYSQGVITRRPPAKSVSSQKSKNTNKSNSKTRGANNVKDQSSKQGYVDLGLPSGTLWKDTNESGGFYTYEETVNRFGDKLPTKEQCEELKDKCQWTWNGSGYEVTGPNGNSIFLPVAGYRDCDGDVRVAGSYGGYWSSTPGGSEEAWSLSFDSGGVYMGSDYRCLGRSVRLVQD